MYLFLLILKCVNTSFATDSSSSLYHVVNTGAVMGYIHVENDKELFANPHVYSIGIENTHLFYSEGPLQILIGGELSLLGLNQSVYIPSGNLNLGYQYYDVFVSLGPRVMLSEISPTNTSIRTNIIIKAGYIFDMQGFCIPIQFGYVPDIQGRNQIHFSLGFSKVLRADER